MIYKKRKGGRGRGMKGGRGKGPCVCVCVRDLKGCHVCTMVCGLCHVSVGKGHFGRPYRLGYPVPWHVLAVVSDIEHCPLALSSSVICLDQYRPAPPKKERHTKNQKKSEDHYSQSVEKFENTQRTVKAMPRRQCS